MKHFGDYFYWMCLLNLPYFAIALGNSFREQAVNFNILLLGPRWIDIKVDKKFIYRKRYKHMVNVQDGKFILKIKVKDAGDFLLDSSVFSLFIGLSVSSFL